MNKDVEDFRRQTDQMNGKEPETHIEHFDRRVEKEEWSSVGFGYEGVKELVFLPKKLIGRGKIQIKELPEDQGYNVFMPYWLAKSRGLVKARR